MILGMVKIYWSFLLHMIPSGKSSLIIVKVVNAGRSKTIEDRYVFKSRRSIINVLTALHHVLKKKESSHDHPSQKVKTFRDIRDSFIQYCSRVKSPYAG